MALINCYLEVDKLKASIGEDGDFAGDDEFVYERSITAASRWIDGHCHRHFWRTPAPTTKLIRPTSRAFATVGDFWSIDGMVVEVWTESGWEELPAQYWQPEPLAPEPGWPWERITPTTYERGWMINSLIPTLRATNYWGWETVPAQVPQACEILSVAYMKAKHISGNRMGFDTDATDPMSPLDLVEHLLEDFAPHKERTP